MLGIAYLGCQGYYRCIFCISNEEPLEVFEPQLVNTKVCLRKAKVGMLIGQIEGN